MKERIYLTAEEMEVARMVDMDPLDFGRGKLRNIGARSERERIVNWLRALDSESEDINRFLPSTLANWIEEGAHNL